MKKLHITTLLILIWGFSYAQQYTNYSVKNGLPSNHVYRITQDYRGFIWFITDKGMVKYNGTDFKKFTIRDGLPTNDIWNVATTPNSNVWYFSKSPKIGYIKNDSIYAFPSAIKGEILNPMNRNIIGNSVTFNNSEAHYQLENNKWKAYDALGSSSKIKQYRNFLKHHKLDRFQFSNNKKHLIFIDKNNDTLKKIKNTLSIMESHTRAQINDSIYLWLSDKDYTVLNLNSYQLKTTLFKIAIGIDKSKYVRMHLLNKQVQITGEGFVSFLDKNYQLVNTHYIPENLKAHFSFVDKQKNLWIATFTNGVYKLPYSKQKAVYDLLDDKVGALKKINGQLTTTVYNKGFYQYDSIGKHFIPFKKEENDYAYGVYDIKELNKTYFITNKKIITLSKDGKHIWYATSKNNYFNEIARQLVYHKGSLYGNFTSGLNKINPIDLSVEKSYNFNGIRTFLSFKNKLIIATSNGLQQLKNDSIVPIQFKKEISTDIYKKPILSLKKIDKEHILVGTDAYGAIVTDLEEIIPLKETEYLSINNIFIDNNDIWLATNNGVYQYQKKSNQYVFKNHFTTNDGLLVNNVNSVFVTDKSLMISSNKGVVTIPKKKTKNQFINLYFENIQYDNNSIKNTNAVKYKKNNLLQVNVAAIDFSEDQALQYEYQLYPFHKKWIQTTSKQITFNNLFPNDYQLKIKSKNKENTFLFTIQPLWYQTLLMRIVFSVLFLSLLVGVLFLLRKKELHKQEQKLNAQKQLAEFELHALRSQMNPHFVFNSLNAIQYYITKNEIDLSEKYLVKFSRLIRMFFDFSREEEITLAEEIKLLKSYLEIEKMRFGNKLSFQFIIDKQLAINEMKIPTMLLQPIVENAVNHGVFHKKENGVIVISFKAKSKQKYVVIIADDGVGVLQSKAIQQQSLKNSLENKKHSSTHVIQERIALLNKSKKWQIAYQIIENNPLHKSGTTVQLTFTLK